MRGLPIRVIQQLVRCYGDWRRSRDVISRLDESGGGGAQPVAGRNTSGGASSYFHTLRSFYAR